MKNTTKYRILIILVPLLVAGIIAAIGAGPKEVKRFYEHNHEASLPELKKMGNEYTMRGEADSAMACYSIIMNAYSPSMSDEEKKICASAFNNAGYLYFMKMQDFTQAYYYLIRALEIAEECGYYKGMPNIYLNMGNVFANYGNDEEAHSSYLKAMSRSLEMKDYEKFLIGYVNLFSGAYIEGSYRKAAAYASSLDTVTIPGEHRC